MYCGYGAAFDGKDEGNIGNNSAWNVLIFGVDNSSSSHTANRKNDLLMLSEGDTVGLIGGFGRLKKKFSIDFSKAKTKCCLCFH